MKEISEKKSETENEVLHSAQTLIEPSIFYRFDSTGFNSFGVLIDSSTQSLRKSYYRQAPVCVSTRDIICLI